MKIYKYFLILFPVVLFAQNNLQEYEGYYLFNQVYPDDYLENPFWFPNNKEVQGITNDGENWFITVTGHEDLFGTSTGAKLWKIPLNVPLGSNSTNNPNVLSIDMEEIPELANENWHWGDPDHYKYNDTDYILVPVYGGDLGYIIACFQADNLEFISYSNINSLGGSPGWCAIDNNGYLYSSSSETSTLKKYSVNWEIFTNPDNNDNALNLIETINLTFNDAYYNTLKHMQGGEFSNSGELLYLVSGSAGGCVPCIDLNPWGGINCDGCGVLEKKVGPGQPENSDGIHVFTTSNWTEIQTSIKDFSENEYFNYYFTNDNTGQSPEGLTVWDLEDINEVKGSLHVLIFDWDLELFGGNNHDVGLFHFSHSVYVDKENGVIPPTYPLTGTQTNPFQTINDAYSFYPIWDGAQIVIKSGIYNDIGIYSTRIRMISEGGTVIIGQQ